MTFLRNIFLFFIILYLITDNRLYANDADIRSFINRLYINSYNKNADPKGVIYWRGRLKNDLNAFGISRYFYKTGIKNQNLNDEDFIKRSYDIFFSRKPDTKGFNYWFNRLKTKTVTRDMLFYEFALSEEFKRNCNKYSIKHADKKDKLTVLIDRFYYTVLGREADPKGEEYWYKNIKSGKKTLFESIKYLLYLKGALKDDYDNEKFVSLLYKALLNREKNSKENAFWKERAEKNSKETIIKDILSSKEFQNIINRINHIPVVKTDVKIPTLINSVYTPRRFEKMVLSKDGKKIFTFSFRMIKSIIIDISDIYNPTYKEAVGYPLKITHFVLSEDKTRAFASTEEKKFYIMNVTDLSNPVKIGSIDLKNDVYKIILSKNKTKIFIAYSNSIDIIDISDPSNPYIAGSIDINTSIGDIILSKDETTAYISSGLYFKIVDIKDPLNPTILSKTDKSYMIIKMILSEDGKKIYMIKNSSLEIIDITDSSKPKTLGILYPPGETRDLLFLEGEKKAVLSSGKKGLQIIDISDPSNIVVKGYIKVKGFIYSIIFDRKKTKIFATNGYLQIIDLNKKYAHSVITKLNHIKNIILNAKDEDNDTLKYIITQNPKHGRLTQTAFGFEYLPDKDYTGTDTFIYKANDGMSSSNEGIVHIKVDYDFINRIDTNGYVRDVILSSDETKAYITDGFAGMKIIDIKNDKNLSVLGSLNINKNSLKMAISEDETKAFLADDYGYLEVIDISDCLNPKIISSKKTEINYATVFLSKDKSKTFMALCRYNMFLIIDPNNPKTAIKDDSKLLPPSCVYISKDRTKAFVATPMKNFRIIDISDIYKQNIIASLKLKGDPNSIILSKDETTAYISSGYGGLYIVDVTNPGNPKLIKNISTPGYALGLTLSKDERKIFLADGYYGMEIIDNNF